MLVREAHGLVATCTHPDWGSNLQPCSVLVSALTTVHIGQGYICVLKTGDSE